MNEPPKLNKRESLEKAFFPANYNWSHWYFEVQSFDRYLQFSLYWRSCMNDLNVWKLSWSIRNGTISSGGGRRLRTRKTLRTLQLQILILLFRKKLFSANWDFIVETPWFFLKMRQQAKRIILYRELNTWFKNRFPKLQANVFTYLPCCSIF